MNTEERSHRFVIRVTGSHELEHLEVLTEAQPLSIGPVSSRVVPVRVRAEPEHARKGSKPITFVVEASDDAKRPRSEIFSVKERSSFFVPGDSR
jgi:hypothetical protein